jgi:predicted membrane protein
MSEPLHHIHGFGPHAAGKTSRNWVTGRMVVGLLLLAFGALWTLDNLDIIEARNVTRWWPVILLAWGLCLLTGCACRRRLLAGSIWTFVGGWLLLWQLDLVPYSLFDLWPLALIVVGGLLVARAWRGRSFRSRETEAEPVASAFVIMGGVERKVVAQEFRGGEVDVVMGGAVIDLRGAGLASDGATIDVFAMFGGIDLIVPEGWRVIGRVTPLFGGFEDNTVPPADPGAPALTVHGMVLMGGVEVKHGRDASSRRAERRHEWHGHRSSRESDPRTDDFKRDPGPGPRD